MAVGFLFFGSIATKSYHSVLAVVSGQRGEESMVKKLTPDQFFEAVSLITSQMVDGNSEKVKLAVQSYLNSGEDDCYSVSWDALPLYRCAAILKALSDKRFGISGTNPYYVFSFSEETRKKFYPIITEPGLEGLEWKPELIFELPVPEVEQNVLPYSMPFIVAANGLMKVVEEEGIQHLDFDSWVISGGKRRVLRITVEEPKQD